MTDPLAKPKADAEDRLLDALHNIEALGQALREEGASTKALEAWRGQAIRQVKDALAVAQELGIQTNERNSA